MEYLVEPLDATALLLYTRKPRPKLNSVAIGVSDEDRENCIVLYASFNKDTFDEKKPTETGSFKS